MAVITMPHVESIPPKGGGIMKKSIRVWIVLALLLSGKSGMGWAGEPIPQPGDTMPVIRLPDPKAANHLQYLGIKAGSRFALTEIKGEVLIIQIFNMY